MLTQYVLMQIGCAVRCDKRYGVSGESVDAGEKQLRDHYTEQSVICMLKVVSIIVP